MGLPTTAATEGRLPRLERGRGRRQEQPAPWFSVSSVLCDFVRRIRRNRRHPTPFYIHPPNPQCAEFPRVCIRLPRLVLPRWVRPAGSFGRSTARLGGAARRMRVSQQPQPALWSDRIGRERGVQLRRQSE